MPSRVTEKYSQWDKYQRRQPMIYLYDLFISYATERTNFARKIEQKATAKGLDVFLAMKDLHPGDRWENVI
jgi:hypothetical protein